MGKSLLGNADDRPRVHVWAHAKHGAGWSHGPNGVIRPASSIGKAVEDAIAELKEKPAVIIWEGRME